MSNKIYAVLVIGLIASLGFSIKYAYDQQTEVTSLASQLQASNNLLAESLNNITIRDIQINFLNQSIPAIKTMGIIFVTKNASLSLNNITIMIDGQISLSLQGWSSEIANSQNPVEVYLAFTEARFHTGIPEQKEQREGFYLGDIRVPIYKMLNGANVTIAFARAYPYISEQGNDTVSVRVSIVYLEKWYSITVTENYAFIFVPMDAGPQ